MFPLIEIEHPLYLLLLLLIPILFILKKYTRDIGLVFSSLIFFNEVKSTLKSKLYPILFYINTLAIITIIISLSKPYIVNDSAFVKQNVNDIMFVLDVSGSMQQNTNTNMNKLNISRDIIKEIINKRKNDNFGLIIYSKDALTLSPLTKNKKFLNDFLIQDYNNFLEDGTALGNAIASAVNRIKFGEEKNKHIFLFTDGLINTGEIDPLLAAQLANKHNTKIHSIDLNTNQKSNLLETISANTRGLYFSIQNGSYPISTIIEDKQEDKYLFTKTSKKQSLHEFFIFISLILVVTETILHYTYLRRFM